MAKTETTLILSNRLEELTEKKRDENPKLSNKVQAAEMNIPYQTFNKYLHDNAECNVTYLKMMAKYYSVSTDYLLGLSEIPTNDANLQAVCEYTGLSEKAIENITSLNEHNRATWGMNVTNDILSSSDFMLIIYYIARALTTSDHEITYDVFRTTKKIIGKTQVVSIFQNVLDRISEKYESVPDYRFMYANAYDMFDNGKLTIEQLKQVIIEYDKGNFDFDPRQDIDE